MSSANLISASITYSRHRLRIPGIDSKERGCSFAFVMLTKNWESGGKKEKDIHPWSVALVIHLPRIPLRPVTLIPSLLTATPQSPVSFTTLSSTHSVISLYIRLTICIHTILLPIDPDVYKICWCPVLLKIVYTEGVYTSATWREAV